MNDKIKIAVGINEMTIVYDIKPSRSDTHFTVRIRTAKNAHINVPINFSDVKALHAWLAKRILDADEPRDEVAENQLDMFQL
ncbi:hypothetical protein [Acidisphaera sp. L21]|uniref:hypothetical protein n=1 Tax=Acidisphaera sp. L21 TaxID=1641851 RepID=UPI00131C5B6E|nr:hypothetical protein [Acidisphaera sp. L21]